MRIEESNKKIEIFWFIEKRGFGLRRSQFICGATKTARNRFLREKRKEKKIYLSRKRYYLTKEFYEELREKHDKFNSQ